MFAAIWAFVQITNGASLAPRCLAAQAFFMQEMAQFFHPIASDCGLIDGD